jgi:HK97 gp10 family phage protein
MVKEMADQVKVTGLQELGAAMDLAPKNLERRVLSKAIRAAGKLWEEAVRARAPKDSGELARKIEVKTSSKGGIFKAIVGVIYERRRASSSRKQGGAPSSEDPAVYAQFLEFGRPNRKGHTHQAAQPFMRPVFDTESDAAAEKFAETVRNNLGDLVG